MTNAALYLRISSDPRDSGLGVERQKSETKALAEALGWTITDVITDNDRSAAPGKVRPGFDRLLGGLKSGDWDALLAWDQDRLTRDSAQWAVLRQTMLSKGTLLALATARSVVPLEGSTGLLGTGLKALMAEGYVEEIRARQKAWAAQRAAAGKPHGAAPYGMKRQDGLDVEDPETAPVVREIVLRLLAGETVHGIVRDLNAREVPSPSGGAWTRRGVRAVVMRPALYGLRSVKGEVIGSAASPGLMDEGTWERVKALLTDPDRRKTGAGNVAAHLLSGIAVCGVCGAGVRARAKGYSCPEGHVHRHRPWVDKATVDHVVAYLSRPDVIDVLTPSAPDLKPMVEEVSALQARLDLAADDYADGVLDSRAYTRATARTQERLDQARRALASARKAAGVPDVLDGLATASDVSEAWEGLTLDRQRAVVRLLVEVTILPVDRSDGGRLAYGTDADRSATIRVEPRM